MGCHNEAVVGKRADAGEQEALVVVDIEDAGEIARQSGHDHLVESPGHLFISIGPACPYLGSAALQSLYPKHCCVELDVDIL